MNTKTFVMALAMGSLLIGCKSDKDSGGDSGTSNACGDDGGEDGGDGSDGGAGNDSCDWDDLDICFEFSSGDTETWCSDIGATYSISTTYNAGECPNGAVAQCAIPTGGDFDNDATAYYYEPSYDADSAAAACASAGGSK